ncbi:sensor histidine kinase [Pycnococcus provasolii]
MSQLEEEKELVVVEEEEGGGDFHAARDDSARSLGGRSTESAAASQQSMMSRDTCCATGLMSPSSNKRARNTSEDTLIRDADDVSVQVEAEVAEVVVDEPAATSGWLEAIKSKVRLSAILADSDLRDEYVLRHRNGIQGWACPTTLAAVHALVFWFATWRKMLPGITNFGGDIIAANASRECVEALRILGPSMVATFSLLLFAQAAACRGLLPETTKRMGMRAYQVLVFGFMLHLIPLHVVASMHGMEELASSQITVLYVLLYAAHFNILRGEYAVASLIHGAAVAIAIAVVSIWFKAPPFSVVSNFMLKSGLLAMLYQLELGKRELFAGQQNMSQLAKRITQEEGHRFKTTIQTIMHDLKPPVRTLEHACEQAEPDMRVITNLARQVKHQILALNQYEDAPKAYGLINLSAHLTKLTDMYMPMFERLGQSFTLDNKIDESVTSCVPMEMLDRAVANLLSNSSKFTPSDGAIVLMPSVNHLEEGGGMLIIEVCDTGKGIPVHSRGEIWHRGNRGNSATTAMEGLGLGLANVKAFAEAESGKVWCKGNQTGEGVTLGFSIKLKDLSFNLSEQLSSERQVKHHRDDNESSASSSTTKAPPSSYEENAHLRILLVEDDKPQRLVMNRCMKKLFPRAMIEVAVNGLEGLECMRERFFDLVLSDMVMPIMDGTTMLRLAKNEGCIPRVAILVTHNIVEDNNDNDAFHVYDKGVGMPTIAKIAHDQLMNEDALAKLRILIVEDDSEQMNVLRKRLEARLPEAEAHCAMNGKEGLLRMNSLSFDALITDFHLPQMNGMQMVNSAREWERLPSITKIVTASIGDKTSENIAEKSGLSASDLYTKGNLFMVDDLALALQAPTSNESSSRRLHRKMTQSGQSETAAAAAATPPSTPLSSRDIDDVSSTLHDETVAKSLIRRHRSLVHAMQMCEEETMKHDIHKLRGWGISLHLHELVRACAAYKDVPGMRAADDVRSCIEELLGIKGDENFLSKLRSEGGLNEDFDGSPQAKEGTSTQDEKRGRRRSIDDVSKTSLEAARRVTARVTNRLLDLLRSSIPIELIETLSLLDDRSDFGKSMIPLHHDAVAIIFVDKVGSTRLSEEMKSQHSSVEDGSREFVKHMQAYFSGVDQIAKQCRVEKIRTIGDGYLATVGVFEDYHRDKASRRTNRDGTSRVADALDFGKRIILQYGSQVRVGVHFGSCESCIIGQTSAQFDLFGSDVNFCARLEAACKPGCLHASSQVMDVLQQSGDDAAALDDPAWVQESLTSEYKGFDGAIRTTLLSPREPS